MEEKQLVPYQQVINKDLYVDEPCVMSFFYGELGWFLSRFQAHLRFLKHHKYKDRKFILFTDLDYHIFVEDFVSYTIELPDWFYELGLERDCYEAPLSGSPPGSLTPPKVYARLIEYFRTFYDYRKAIEIFPPRGCTDIMNLMPQLFRKFIRPKITLDREIICVMPRGRARAPQRNVPEFVWKEVVEELRQYFIVVLCGTPTGSYLSGYNAEGVINLIDYGGDDKMVRIVHYLNSAISSIRSQSGLTHVSLQCDCPSYIIGHEKVRHAREENKFDTPVSFRYVYDYRAIDAPTILKDVAEMLDNLKQVEYNKQVNYIQQTEKSIENLDNLIEDVLCQKRK